VIERPLPVTFDGIGYVIVDVENGPDAFTTVRIFNASGFDQDVRMFLFSADGAEVARCEIPVVQNRQTLDWCMQPSDFGAERFATLRITTSSAPCEKCAAVSAFVTKLIQP
jgi:hypothetical protein